MTERAREIEKRLDNMGLNERDRPNCQEIRRATRQYYNELVTEDLANSEGQTITRAIDAAELPAMGFSQGYQFCLRTRG